MRWPKKILYDESHLNDDDDYADDDKDDDDDELYLYEESHLNEDRKEAAKSDDDASMSLIPTANPHFLKFCNFLIFFICFLFICVIFLVWSFSNEDRKEAAKSDDDASMRLIPTAHIFTLILKSASTKIEFFNRFLLMETGNSCQHLRLLFLLKY